MRILVHEHLTATAPPSIPSHLLRQGEAMIRALLADLRRVAGVTVVLMPPARPGEADVMARFERALENCDAVWPIAPESGGCLEELSRRVLARGRLLLNSRPDAVRTAGSKWLTWRALSAANVAAIPTYRNLADAARDCLAVVAKPDDGAGCEKTYLLRAGETRTGLPANAVFQPWVEGAARSFSMLCSDRGAEMLCRNAQHVSVRDGVLWFEGVDIAINEDDTRSDSAGTLGSDEGTRSAGMRTRHAGRGARCDVAVAGGAAGHPDCRRDEPIEGIEGQHDIAELARRVHAALPELRGFVGVDYIESVRGPVVVEVNPRLTTAYVGLSARLRRNLAADVLHAITGVNAGVAS